MAKNKAVDVENERQNTKTSLSLSPLSVDEALAALLKTPPPADKPKATKKRKKNTTRRKR